MRQAPDSSFVGDTLPGATNWQNVSVFHPLEGNHVKCRLWRGQVKVVLMRLLTTLTFLFSVALSLPAWADFTGKVVGVADGDTLTVLRGHEQVKVRLVEVDAPEKAQPFGNKSKQSLSELCFGKTATLADQGKDRYRRTLARVYCDGIDANAQQVRRGMAWVYRKYTPKDSPLYAVENEAKSARRGLWADPAPMAPWEWRHR